MGRATCTGDIRAIPWLVRLQCIFFVSYLLWEGLVPPALVGKVFWNSGSDRKVILLRSRSFALELRKRRTLAHVQCTVAMQVWRQDSISTQPCGKAVHIQGLMPETNQ